MLIFRSARVEYYHLLIQQKIFPELTNVYRRRALRLGSLPRVSCSRSPMTWDATLQASSRPCATRP